MAHLQCLKCPLEKCDFLKKHLRVLKGLLENATFCKSHLRFLKSHLGKQKGFCCFEKGIWKIFLFQKAFRFLSYFPHPHQILCLNFIQDEEGVAEGLPGCAAAESPQGSEAPPPGSVAPSSSGRSPDS